MQQIQTVPKDDGPDRLAPPPHQVSNAGSALAIVGNITFYGAVTMADGGVALPQVIFADGRALLMRTRASALFKTRPSPRGGFLGSSRTCL